MDVHAKLAEVRQAVEQARSMPMSASAVVNRAELLGMLDDLGTALEAAFSDARRLMADQQSVVDEGQRKADEIIRDARNERDKILSDTEVYRMARHQADELLEKARTESDELRKETDDYVDAKLANFEITLERTMEAVRRGRERLAGRTDLHALADDTDVDQIVLPDHFDN